jgi:2-amino-4-hydroxy-6-hydroxymethyldihydropteridine diphosphokinase
VVKRSGIYETEPWGFKDSTPFLNQVIEIETTLDPDALLGQLLSIETRLGRIRPFDGCGCGVTSLPGKDGGKGGSELPSYSGRTIDLDILFYGNKLVFTESLMIPHPHLHERRFTLVPLNEVAPDFVHPLLKKTVSGLLGLCRDRSNVKSAGHV